jgi:hypothetical protein
MRGRIALSVPALVSVAVLASGCAASTATSGTTDGGRPSASSTVNVSANGKLACNAVRQATDRYSSSMDTATDSSRPGIAQAWAAEIGKAAQDATDSSLQAALLSLADVVRAWAARAPSKVAVTGYNNDLNVACRPYATS